MRGLLLALVLLSCCAVAQELDCAGCHDQQAKAISTSAHQNVTCATCHKGYTEVPHPPNLPKPECSQCHQQIAAATGVGVHGRARAAGNEAAPDCSVCHGVAHQVQPPGTQTFRQSIPELCGGCHSEQFAEYSESMHGTAVKRGIVAAPVCSTCHGEHAILPPKQAGSSVSPARIPETCGQCHGDVRLTRQFQLPNNVVPSFQASFHGLALQGGRQTVANCASCHAAHLILPPSDPRSKINPRNIANTCGACHPGAGQRFAIAKIHWSADQGEPRLVRWVRLAYYFLIPFALGFMLLHGGADWIRKLVTRRIHLTGGPDFNPGPEMAARRHPAAFRMYRAERIQHVLLVLSFTVLVWSGFALTYPDHWWARPLLITQSLRGIIHRIAGGVLIGIAISHLITLAVDRRLREHWKLMLPAPGDVAEVLNNLRWLLGLRRDRPRLSSHSYVEKIEYWAVIWGTFIMGATGLMLWANTLVLRHLSKLALDVAIAVHFYEAVLASLAIIIWHFYYVIFDPEVYPMDPAWLTGYSVRPRLHDEEVEHATGAPAEEPGGPGDNPPRDS